MRLATRAAGMCCAVLGVSFATFGAWVLLGLWPQPHGELTIDLGDTIARVIVYGRIAAWLFLGVVASFATAVGGTAWLASERDRLPI